jgi:bifunctional DNA-binding transcriptional regulator/antitoxin component of YhaV-PrlF toxin-antitoxin module
MNKEYLKTLTDNNYVTIPVPIVKQFNWQDQLLKLCLVDNSIIVEETNKNDFISPFVKKLSNHTTSYRLILPKRLVQALKWKSLKLTVFEDEKKIIIKRSMKK